MYRYFLKVEDCTQCEGVCKVAELHSFRYVYLPVIALIQR